MEKENKKKVCSKCKVPLTKENTNNFTRAYAKDYDALCSVCLDKRMANEE